MTLATQEPINPETLAQVMMEGDLAQLSPEQRIEYYAKLCASLDLNPLTRPFEYIKFQGKLTLYAKKDATEQLAANHEISIGLEAGREVGDAYIAQARASRPDGRFADATGVVAFGSLKGDNLANALMKAETKACRRAVLRLVGLGWLDETETETIPGAVSVKVDSETGEVTPPEPQKQPSQPRQQWMTRQWNAWKKAMKEAWGDNAIENLKAILPEGVDPADNNSMQKFVDRAGIKDASMLTEWCKVQSGALQQATTVIEHEGAEDEEDHADDGERAREAAEAFGVRFDGQGDAAQGAF